ncbi:MAG TPA: 50S ribosomal protein L11 methyltransferase [Clostridiales bacterium]|jgi:ribosomal protein L11 methyltransferase|nr:50S ribosomal protein L11 methyltransferase [Clostridiales bacterium]
MNWIELAVSTTHEGVDLLGDALIEAGVAGFSVEDSVEIAEFIERDLPIWQDVDEQLLESLHTPYCRLVTYLADNAEGQKMLSLLTDVCQRVKAMWPAVDFGTLEFSVRTRKEDEWADAWKAFYKPFPVGERLLVKPEWETITEEQAKGRVVYISNPGMAFGSGDHATTKLCMLALEKHVKGKETVLDVGCGSGILSIIAALLGAKKVLGVDIDPYAAEVAAKNAAQNKVEHICSFFAGNTLGEDFTLPGEDTQFDMVLANIVADVIIPLASRLAAWTKSGGLCMISGVLHTRIEEVRSALEKEGFSALEQTEENDWCALLLRKD